MKVTDIKRYCEVCGALYTHKEKYCYECKAILIKVESLNQTSGSERPYILTLFGSVSK